MGCSNPLPIQTVSCRRFWDGVEIRIILDDVYQGFACVRLAGMCSLDRVYAEICLGITASRCTCCDGIHILSIGRNQGQAETKNKSQQDFSSHFHFLSSEEAILSRLPGSTS